MIREELEAGQRYLAELGVEEELVGAAVVLLVIGADGKISRAATLHAAATPEAIRTAHGFLATAHRVGARLDGCWTPEADARHRDR